jgi:hypothetical protein
MINPYNLKRDVMSPEILSDPEGEFPRHSNRSSFLFRHGLSGHPLLQLPSLIALADRLEKHNGCYWSNGSVDITDRWDKGTERRQSLRTTLENIADNDSLVILKFVVHDPTAGAFYRDILSALVRLAGPQMAADILVGRATILIASPHRLTSYHIDADLNYLVQVAGDKTFAVYNQEDRTIVTDEELESFFNGDDSAAVFKPDRQTEVTHYDLGAGLGVHVPCMAPHWARNGPDVSIAVSCNFDLASMERLGLIYKTNHRLRSLGIKSSSPRDQTWTNSAKALGARTVFATRNLLRSRVGTFREVSGWKLSD